MRVPLGRGIQRVSADTPEHQGSDPILTFHFQKQWTICPDSVIHWLLHSTKMNEGLQYSEPCGRNRKSNTVGILLWEASTGSRGGEEAGNTHLSVASAKIQVIRISTMLGRSWRKLRGLGKASKRKWHLRRIWAMVPQFTHAFKWLREVTTIRISWLHPLPTGLEFLKVRQGTYIGKAD